MKPFVYLSLLLSTFFYSNLSFSNSNVTKYFRCDTNSQIATFKYTPNGPAVKKCVRKTQIRNVECMGKASGAGSSGWKLKGWSRSTRKGKDYARFQGQTISNSNLCKGTLGGAIKEGFFRCEHGGQRRVYDYNGTNQDKCISWGQVSSWICDGTGHNGVKGDSNVTKWNMYHDEKTKLFMCESADNRIANEDVCKSGHRYLQIGNYKYCYKWVTSATAKFSSGVQTGLKQPNCTNGYTHKKITNENTGKDHHICVRGYQHLRNCRSGFSPKETKTIAQSMTDAHSKKCYGKSFYRSRKEVTSYSSRTFSKSNGRDQVGTYLGSRN